MLSVALVVLLFQACYAQSRDFEAELAKVSSAEDFCKFLSPSDCEKLLNLTTYGIGYNEDGKMAVAAGGNYIAMFDACNPRELTVPVPQHPDPTVIVLPSCTRALRCGGCCNSRHLSCEPTETRKKIINVVDNVLRYAGADQYEVRGVRAVTIEEHVRCEPRCKIKASDCHPSQIYDSRKCACECSAARLSLRNTCTDHQIWDDSVCACVCPNMSPTSCPQSQYFNTKTCSCSLKSSVVADIDVAKLIDYIDRGLIDPDVILRKDLIYVVRDTTTKHVDISKSDNVTVKKETPLVTSSTVSTSSTTATTSTTSPISTTTTETTSTKTTESPCKHKLCIGSWKPKLLDNGVCECRPPFFFP